jgi:DNA-binding transcriptional LysR family regulator
MSVFDIEALRTFVRVCELGSLTAAARHLGMTQAAVSQRVKKLETQAKGLLIDRDFRPVKLTPSGKALFQRARGILADLARVQVDHAERLNVPLDSLRLGVTDSLGTVLLPELVPKIRRIARHLLIKVDSSASLCNGLLQRDLDVVVSTDQLSAYEGLERHLLLREPLVLVYRCSERVIGETSYSILEWLAGHRPFVRYSAVSPLAQQIEAHLSRIRIDASRTLEFSSSEAIIEMVKHGLGWTITTPINLLQTRVNLAGLEILRLPRGEVNRSIWLIARSAEFGSLPTRLTTLSRQILTRTVGAKSSPEISRLMPLVQIGKEISRKLVSPS